MKKLVFTILLVTMALSAAAQDGLRVAEVFAGKLIPKERISETLVKGSKLRSLDLETFHSIRFKATASELDRVAALVMEDSRLASDKEIESQDGHMQYAIFSMAGADDGLIHYLCFQSKKDPDNLYNIIIVYMEGSTSLQELKKKLK